MTDRPSFPLLFEAGAGMLAASAIIRIAPFRWIARHSGRHFTGKQAPQADVALIVRSIRAWSRRLPWRTKCFEEGLSAHWMLRRRQFASTLHYGAATIEGELKAHVWVRSGEVDVIGCENAADFALLARFPAH